MDFWRPAPRKKVNRELKETENKTRIWFTADTHFGHANIIKYCDRPFLSVEEMDREMIRRWRAAVAPTDTVYHLGDFAFGKPERIRRILSKLPGHKILVRGNHDKGKVEEMGWDTVIYGHTAIQIPKRRVLLSHYPYKPTKEEAARLETEGYQIRQLERRPVDRGLWLLHGHVHERWKVRDRMVNVGVDIWDFCPVSLEEIVKTIEGAGR